MKLHYRSSSIDNEWKIQFSNFEMNMNEDLTITWSAFYRYETNGLIEVDAIVARSTKNIINMLKHPQPSLNDEM